MRKLDYFLKKRLKKYKVEASSTHLFCLYYNKINAEVYCIYSFF